MIPNFLAGALNTDFRYAEGLAVTDVQTIIDKLYDELVTGLSWTCTLGGKTITPTTYKSPARSDGLFMTVNLTRISATRLGWIVKDHNGLLINNQTDTRQDIDAGGTTVHYYTGKTYVAVSSERATPEAFYCAILDRTPDDAGNPRASYVTSVYPRNTAGTLSTAYWDNAFILTLGNTAYAGNLCSALPRTSVSATYDLVTLSGAQLWYPVEFIYNSVFYGRVPQCLQCGQGNAYAAEFTVPIDAGVTGVFKVFGIPSALRGRIAFRKA